MFRVGFYTGKIYNANDNPRECCFMVSQKKQVTDKLKRHFKEKCNECRSHNNWHDCDPAKEENKDEN